MRGETSLQNAAESEAAGNVDRSMVEGSRCTPLSAVVALPCKSHPISCKLD